MFEKYDFKSLPPNHPIWFQLHVGVAGLWKFPERFVVDSDLYGRATTNDEKVPELFRRIIEEFTNGGLNMDQFGLALQKLSRRSTREEFEWFRKVLEQRVQIPCSPRELNKYAPRQWRVFEPTIPLIKVYKDAYLVLPLQAILIEEYINQRRIFIEPSQRAYDDVLKPKPEWVDEFSPTFDGDSLRFELYDGRDATLRDVIRMDQTNDPKWKLPERIDTVMNLWGQLGTSGLNIVERTMVSPEGLKAEIDLIRDRGFEGFNILTENTDALMFGFDRNPSVVVEDNRILICQDP